jgi:hypothetical protein
MLDELILLDRKSHINIVLDITYMPNKMLRLQIIVNLLDS